MKRLVIDDVRVMTFPAEYARTPEEAIFLLDGLAWDEVWFDYDLGGVYGRLETEDTIMPVVDWIEREIHEGRKPAIGLCVIHTMNPAGRQQLVAALSRHYPTRHVTTEQYTRSILGAIEL